jgi:phosphoglycolate phosphatase
MVCKLVIFDLDGVLINSKKNMEKSWNYVKKKYNLNSKFNSYFSHIGIPFKKILDKLNIKKKKNNIEKDYSLISLKNFKTIKAYPNASNICSILKKKKIIIAIITSKDLLRSTIILNYMKIKYDLLLAPESNKKLKPKPSAQMPTYVLKKFKISKKNALFVGDTINDYKSSKLAGIPFVFAKYGYGKIDDSTIFKINKLIELKKIIN